MSRNRICLDVDQVLVDFVSGWGRQAERILQRPVPEQNREFPMNKRFGLTHEEANKVWEAFNEPEAWEELPLYPQSPALIRSLQSAGYDVHCITSIPSVAVDSRVNAFTKALPGVSVHQAESLENGKRNGAPTKEEWLKKLQPVFYADDCWPHIWEAMQAGVPAVIRIDGGHEGRGNPVAGITTANDLTEALLIWQLAPQKVYWKIQQ